MNHDDKMDVDVITVHGCNMFKDMCPAMYGQGWRMIHMDTCYQADFESGGGERMLFTAVFERPQSKRPVSLKEIKERRNKTNT